MNQILELLKNGVKLRVVRKLQSELTADAAAGPVDNPAARPVNNAAAGPVDNPAAGPANDTDSTEQDGLRNTTSNDVLMISVDGNLEGCLKMAAGIKGPVILEVCFHKVFCYGLAAFASDLQAAGLDAVRVPDLPYEERGQLAVHLLDLEGPFLISEITPASGDRIMAITQYARGFVWCSGRGVPGKLRELPGDPLEFYLYAVDAACPVPYVLDFPGMTENRLTTYAEAAEGAAGYLLSL